MWADLKASWALLRQWYREWTSFEAHCRAEVKKAEEERPEKLAQLFRWQFGWFADGVSYPYVYMEELQFRYENGHWYMSRDDGPERQVASCLDVGKILEEWDA